MATFTYISIRGKIRQNSISCSKGVSILCHLLPLLLNVIVIIQVIKGLLNCMSNKVAG